MTRALPTTADVEQAMAQVLAEAATTGRRATISAVERRLGLPHATFYRNFADLIQQYQQQASPPNTAAALANGDGPDGPTETIRRLRSENEDLRRTLRIYAEAIRQLTTRNEELADQLHRQASITTIAPRSRSERTTDIPRRPS
jgi:AcrR family transcriptional regulator